MAFLAYINPFKVYRDFVRRPIESFVTEQYIGYKKKTNDSITSVKELLYRAGVVLVFFSAILWISIFMYVIFYYTYMPNVTHVRPVHLQFKSCDENMGVCSFPSAHVQLTRRSQMLMSSQPYRVKLVMEVPETQINKDLGMFMVCAQMRAAGGGLVSSSCRSAMLRHRSKLHHVMRTLVYAPLLVSGFNEEKQLIHVELFSDFEDDQTHPVTDAYVELQSRFVQVLSCELHIEAHFTGLRYVMYYWPKISALIGICSNLFFVSLMFILSWYHLQDGLPDYFKTKLGIEIKNENTEDDRKSFGKMKLEREDSFPFIEEEALLEEFQKQEKKKSMFMVCAQMRAVEGALLSSSCRTTMLKHRSKMHHVMRTLVYAPLLLAGFHEEIQLIHVELFSDFEENQTHPVTDAYVELQSRFVQVLSCELHIEAHFMDQRSNEMKDEKTKEDREPSGKVKLGLEDSFYFFGEQLEE